jgi:hypothetical protein
LGMGKKKSQQQLTPLELQIMLALGVNRLH